MPRTAVRRADRAVTDESWIRSFLRSAPVGTLAMVSDGQPFVNTNLFVFHEPGHVLYLHTARMGRTPSILSEPTEVCFEVHAMGRLLPAKEALEFSVEYAGVVVFGTGRLVEDPEEARRGLQLLLDKYAPHLKPGADYRPIVDEELKRTAVFRIDIVEWSGKRKVAPEAFPGAYRYEEVTPGFDPISR